MSSASRLYSAPCCSMKARRGATLSPMSSVNVLLASAMSCTSESHHQVFFQEDSYCTECTEGFAGCERHSSTAMLDLRSVQSACIAPHADTRAQVSHAFIRLVLRCTLQRAPQLPAKNSRAVCTWTVSRRSMRRAGSSVVAHSCSGIISPRPCSETCRAQALGFGF